MVHRGSFGSLPLINKTTHFVKQLKTSVPLWKNIGCVKPAEPDRKQSAAFCHGGIIVMVIIKVCSC